MQLALRSRKPRFIGSINVDRRGLKWLQMSISRRDVRVRIARADIAQIAYGTCDIAAPRG